MRLLLWIITIGCIALIAEMLNGCAYDGNRDRWKDCGGVHHTVCEGDLGCEYEFYKDCIYDGAAPPDAR